MVKCSKKSLSVSDLWVSVNDRSSDFYLSSWQRGESAVPMLLVRLFLSTASVGILIYSLIKGGDQYWIIYLTNWGLLTVSLLTLTGLLVSFIATLKKVPDTTRLPWYVSIHWLFFNIGVTLAIMITGLYWALLYNAEVEEEFMLDLSTHGFNSCIVFAELVLSRTPVRLLHIYQPLCVSIWYAAFTGIYYAAGGTNKKGDPFIYEIIDWRDAGPTVAIVSASMASMLVVYIALWVVSICRDKLSTLLVRTTSLNLPLTPPDRHMPTNNMV